MTLRNETQSDLAVFLEPVIILVAILLMCSQIPKYTKPPTHMYIILTLPPLNRPAMPLSLKIVTSNLKVPICSTEVCYLVLSTSRGVTTNPEKDPANEPMHANQKPPKTTSDASTFYFLLSYCTISIFKPSQNGYWIELKGISRIIKLRYPL